MGTFTITMRVSGPEHRRTRTVEALVDIGASHTVLPRDLLDELGVRPIRKVPFRLADDRTREYDVGQALVRVDGAEMVVPVVFGETGGPVLLGATTLEILNMGVDPLQRRLVPVPGLLQGMCAVMDGG